MLVASVPSGVPNKTLPYANQSDSRVMLPYDLTIEGDYGGYSDAVRTLAHQLHCFKKPAKNDQESMYKRRHLQQMMNGAVDGDDE